MLRHELGDLIQNDELLKEQKWFCHLTAGQTAGQGVPHILLITRSCANSSFAWNRGFLVNSSPRMQPQLHTSIEGPYLSSPSSSSGGLKQSDIILRKKNKEELLTDLYHKVITLFVYGLSLSSAL